MWHQHEQRKPISCQSPYGEERVLLVDDNESVVRMIQEFLLGLGYDVAIATSGKAALDLFRMRSGKFDIVVTDLTMPRMSGVRLAQEIATIAPGLPILLSTGFGEVPAIDVPPEVRGVIPKPMSMRELAATIRRVLHPG